MSTQKYNSQYDEIEKQVIEENDPLFRTAHMRELREVVDRLVMSAATGGSSGQKVARKARRIFGRTMNKEANRVKMQLKDLLKPRPKWIPAKLWVWMMGFFIKVKK